MVLDGFIQRAYNISEWLTKLMFVNLLWIAFTLMGLLIGGLFPSTAAMYSVTREWVMGKKDTPVFKSFWQAYKGHFIQANLIGYGMLIIGAFLYIDLRFTQMSGNIIFQGLSFLFFFLLLIYYAMLLYIFPVYSHFRLKTMDYIKYTFVIVAGKPILTITMIVASLALILLFRYLPILVLFIGGGLMSYIFMWIAAKAFPKKEAIQLRWDDDETGA